MADAQQEVRELLLDLIKRYYDPHAVSRTDADAEAGTGAVAIPGGYSLKNTSCGDVVTVVPVPGRNGAVRVHVQGCAVCKASAALVERVSSCVSAQQVAFLCDTIVESISGGASVTEETAFPRELPDELRRDLLLICRIREIPGRRRCATLSWEATGTLSRGGPDAGGSG